MLLVVLALLLALAGAQASPLQYGVQFDAGSSGTRVYVYRWDTRRLKRFDTSGPFSRPVTQQGWSMKVQLRLADYGPDPSKVSEALDPLLTFAQNLIVQQGGNVAGSHLFLGATAGMRLLPPATRDAIMLAVQTHFHNSVFSYVEGDARILSGEEEAVFGWIAANYLLNRIPASPANGGLTVGALDMGGASTQITFVPGGSVMEGLFVVGAGKLQYTTYAKSYLQFGMNAMSDRLCMMAVSKQSKADRQAQAPVPHPCLNTGYHVMSKCDDVLPGLGTAYNMSGTSDVATCKEWITTLMAKASTNETICWVEPCGVAGEYIPDLPPRVHQSTDTHPSSVEDSGLQLSSGVFYAMSGYFRVRALLNLTDTEVPLSTWHARVNEYCGWSWKELQEKGDIGPVYRPYLPFACERGLYLYMMLTEGYGFADDSVAVMDNAVTATDRLQADSPAIVFVGDVEGTELAWALGSVLYHANLLPWSLQTSSDSQPEAYKVLTFVFATTTLVALAGVCYLFSRWKKAESNGYAHAINDQYVLEDDGMLTGGAEAVMGGRGGEWGEASHSYNHEWGEHGY